MPEMCWKHLLHSNIEAAKLRYGQAPFSFWPEGWNLPEDYDKLAAYYVSGAGAEGLPIILKPSMQACGNGIRCITNMSQLPPDDPFLEIKSVAQHYIPRPLLLDGYKVTFRIYVLITSYAPLRAYIFPNGLGRICSHRYTEELSSFDNLFAHLTNYDINKHNMADFLETKGEGLEQEGLATDGLRTDFLSVMAYLKRQGHDTELLWQKMKETTALTLLATDSKISPKSCQLVNFRGTTFEILGFDFLIDQSMTPWILEVNHGPNLEPHTELETDLKRSMIRDALHLVDFRRADHSKTGKLAAELSEAVKSMNKAGLSIDSDLKWTQSNGTTGDFPLSSCSPTDIWTLVESEKELERTGEWQAVFPVKNAEEKFTLVDQATGEPEVLHSAGTGGKRNNLLIQLQALPFKLETVLQKSRDALATSGAL